MKSNSIQPILNTLLSTHTFKQTKENSTLMLQKVASDICGNSSHQENKIWKCYTKYRIIKYNK